MTHPDEEINIPNLEEAATWTVDEVLLGFGACLAPTVDVTPFVDKIVRRHSPYKEGRASWLDLPITQFLPSPPTAEESIRGRIDSWESFDNEQITLLRNIQQQFGITFTNQEYFDIVLSKEEVLDDVDSITLRTLVELIRKKGRSLSTLTDIAGELAETERGEITENITIDTIRDAIASLQSAAGIDRRVAFREGLMDDGGHPRSRDFGMEDVACKALQCVANTGGQCISPALAVIGPDGRCTGFKARTRPENRMVHKRDVQFGRSRKTKKTEQEIADERDTSSIDRCAGQ